MTSQTRRGFTLIELTITVAILLVLASASVFAYGSFMNDAKKAHDQTMLPALNAATANYKLEHISSDAFSDPTQTPSALLLLLQTGHYITEIPVPESPDHALAFDFGLQTWTLTSSSSTAVETTAVPAHSLSGSDVTFGTGGFKKYIMSYSGADTNIVIPSLIGDVTPTNVYQDAFRGKGLTSLSFSADTAVTRIHARAFMNNNLTEVSLPPTITRLDYGAFSGNAIVKVTLGAGVYMEGNVFTNQSSFATAYASGGAGTYLYENGIWSKSVT